MKNEEMIHKSSPTFNYSATYYKRLIVTTPRTADMCTEVSRNSFSILLIHKFKKMYIVVTFLYLYIINIDAFMNTHTHTK